MLFLITLLFSVLSLFYIVLPVRAYYAHKAQREFEEAFKLVQLRAIKRHYAIVEPLSYEEIEKHFDIERSYYNI